jgi:hypothetical protein
MPPLDPIRWRPHERLGFCFYVGYSHPTLLLDDRLRSNEQTPLSEEGFLVLHFDTQVRRRLEEEEEEERRQFPKVLRRIWYSREEFSVIG